MFKDQTSLIVFIVAVLLGAIGIGTAYFTKPEPAPVTPVETVALAPATLPAAGVTYANALPGAGTGAGASGSSGLAGAGSSSLGGDSLGGRGSRGGRSGGLSAAGR